MVKQSTKQNTKHLIIDILRKNPNLRFTDIGEKVGISKPALSQHLKELQKDKTVNVKQVGREKFYYLTQHAFKKVDRQMLQSMGRYRDMYAITVGLGHENMESAIEDIEKTISALFFYCIMKGLNTGENWFTNFRLDDFVISTISFLLEIITKKNIPDKIIKKLSNEDIEGLFKQFSKLSLGDLEADKLTELEDMFSNMYSEKWEIIEKD